MSVSSPHLTNETKQRYRARALAPAEVLALDDHLATCDECRRQLAEPDRSADAASFMAADLLTETDEAMRHLTQEELAAYAAAEMAEVDREIAAGHVTICSQCAAELEDLQAFKALMASHPAKLHAPGSRGRLGKRPAVQRFPFLRWTLGGAGAVALAGLVFWMTAQPLHRHDAELQAQLDRARRDKASLSRRIAADKQKLLSEVRLARRGASRAQP